MKNFLTKLRLTNERTSERATSERRPTEDLPKTYRKPTTTNDERTTAYGRRPTNDDEPKIFSFKREIKKIPFLSYHNFTTIKQNV